MTRVIIIDTSILLVYLQVPGKEVQGPEHDQWTWERVNNFLEEHTDATFIIPLAVVIETGNLICYSPKELRQHAAERLAEIIQMCCQGTSPWALFTDQSSLWESEQLMDLAKTWPALTNQNRCHSMGDATIKTVADHYAKMGLEVKILTADLGLKRLQPTPAPNIPRRRIHR